MWVLLTFVIAVVLIFLEVFLPGGILGTIGVISLVTSIVLGFVLYSGSAGLVIMVAELFGAGALLIFGLRTFPHTRAGKRLILNTELDNEGGYVGETTGLRELVGLAGEAETPLRPAGVVRIAGRRIDAVADGEFVERGTSVTVVQVDGNRVVVRQQTAAAPAGEAPAA